MYGQFQPNQLVLINGGANDLLLDLEAAESDPVKLPKALFDIDEAAVDLARVVDRILHSGVKHVGLLNLADFGVAPEGTSTNQGSLITTIIKIFNDTLKASLLIEGDLNKVILIDEVFFSRSGRRKL